MRVTQKQRGNSGEFLRLLQWADPWWDEYRVSCKGWVWRDEWVPFRKGWLEVCAVCPVMRMETDGSDDADGCTKYINYEFVNLLASGSSPTWNRSRTTQDTSNLAKAAFTSLEINYKTSFELTPGPIRVCVQSSPEEPLVNRYKTYEAWLT